MDRFLSGLIVMALLAIGHTMYQHPKTFIPLLWFVGFLIATYLLGWLVEIIFGLKQFRVVK